MTGEAHVNSAALHAINHSSVSLCLRGVCLSWRVPPSLRASVVRASESLRLCGVVSPPCLLCEPARASSLSMNVYRRRSNDCRRSRRAQHDHGVPGLARRTAGGEGAARHPSGRRSVRLRPRPHPRRASSSRRPSCPTRTPRCTCRWRRSTGCAPRSRRTASPIDTTVVVYFGHGRGDADRRAFSSRSIISGSATGRAFSTAGLPAWRAAKQPVSAEAPSVAPGHLTPTSPR